MNNEPSDDWLRQTNERYRTEDISHRHRPWHAWRDYSVEKGLPLELNHPIVQRIFAWFAEVGPSGSQSIGPLYRGVYYYDANFWPVDIPLSFGTLKLDPLESLITMPRPIFDSLIQDTEEVKRYVLHWGACIDYKLSFKKLTEHKPSGFAADLLVSANRELAASAALLVSGQPGAKAGHSAALGAEIFMKWSLAHHNGLTPQKAKHHYSHGMNLLVKDTTANSDPPFSDVIAARLLALPRPEARYDGLEPTHHSLWEHHELVQDIAASLLRKVTGENVRKQIMDKLGP